MARSRHARAGYSLIEMLFAVALMAIVVSQLMLVLTTQHQSYVEQERVTDTQQEARLLTDVLLNDLRMGGFMVPKEAAVGSIDGAAGGSDVLCVSDPSVFVPSSYAGATDRFDGPSVQNVMTGSNPTVTVSTADQDMDGDGASEFVANGGLLISDGSRVHCATIDSVAGSTITFSPATPSGAGFTSTLTVVVPAVVYQVTGASLFRNDLVLSTQTEDLQVEFGVDADGDGEVEPAEFPVHDLTGSNLTRVRLARVHVTSRTATESDTFAGVRAASANRNAGAADGFRRRKIVADARLRNTL